MRQQTELQTNYGFRTCNHVTALLILAVELNTNNDMPIIQFEYMLPEIVCTFHETIRPESHIHHHHMF